MNWFEATVMTEPPAPEYVPAPLASSATFRGDPERMASISMEALLEELAHRKWEKWAFGDERRPLGIAFVLWWPEQADVVVLRGPDRAVTYRAHRDTPSHPFTPESVAWLYVGHPAHAIRNLLLLPPPGALNAPVDVLRPGSTALATHGAPSCSSRQYRGVKRECVGAAS